MTTSDDCPEKAELDTGSRARRLAARLRRRVSRARRDERGLTTLEWLLIVAAVAGLAALAVVLVTNVVDDTSEQISGSSARVTAARVAAQAIVDDADRDATDQTVNAKEWDDWVKHYRTKCDRLTITYGDAGIRAISNFATSGTMGGLLAANIATPPEATNASGTIVTATAADTKAVAQCLLDTTG